MIHYIYCQPIWLLTLISILIIFCCSRINSLLKKQSWQRLFNFILFAFSIFSLIYITILKREGGIFQIELRPFYTFVMAQSQVEYYRTFFMNALLFIPLGISMPYVLSKKPYKRNVFITIIFACLLSVMVEFLQYWYHLGRCETDDVIANTLGAAIGTLSYLLYICILKNREENLMNSKITNNQKLLLDLCAKSLFENECNLDSNIDCDELIKESVNQTVFSQIYSFVKDNASDDANKRFSQIIAKNIRVEYGHNEVHKALTANNIPYVILKGVASASYYKEPPLRMMGDVDILVSPQNIELADKALRAIGFVTNDDLESDSHIAYKRRDGLICELHRNINGIPKNASGEKLSEYFGDIFDKSVEYKTSNGNCVVPSQFHHGLILLLHTATHLTNEGVGLRHLCDWAVFVNNIENDEFINLFEKPLKESGLWRFAQLLTLCCVKYLGCDPKKWAGESNDVLLDGVICDVLNGGNFGSKDVDRYKQIKYISDRKSGEKAKKRPVLQLFSSVNQKTKKEFRFANKSKLLLPVGWVFTICKYLYMVIIGKRQLDDFATVASAKQRIEIYNEFKLYENDQA